MLAFQAAESVGIKSTLVSVAAAPGPGGGPEEESPAIAGGNACAPACGDVSHRPDHVGLQAEGRPAPCAWRGSKQ